MIQGAKRYWIGVNAFVFVVMVHVAGVLAAPTVQASLGETDVWAGQRVTLIVTLYSPGPFSGTASFDLPEIPGVIIVQGGSPVVGSEQVDGETYFTQRHELGLYSQQTGELILPSFRVRYMGKKSFTSDPEPMEGTTEELRCLVKRPPGTTAQDAVVTAESLKVTQVWNPRTIQTLQAGDVVRRTITRNATGTLAMLLPPLGEVSAEGVKIYASEPQVYDDDVRGQSTATRVDEIRYQFRAAGTFELQAIEFVWWDLTGAALKRETLPGLKVEVKDAEPDSEQLADETAGQRNLGKTIAIVGGLVTIGVLCCLTPLVRLFHRWRTFRQRPEAVAVRQLRTACRTECPNDAYHALRTWLTVRLGDESCRSIDELLRMPTYAPLAAPWQNLSRRLFSGRGEVSVWDGAGCWRAFQLVRRSVRRGAAAPDETRSRLMPLNPL